MELSLTDDDKLYIDEYIYRPEEGKHILRIRNDNHVTYNFEVTKKVTSMNINEVYTKKVLPNNSTDMEFTIHDRIAPNELSLSIDYNNIVYDSDNDKLTIPYTIPPGNDTFNLATYRIVVKNSTTGTVVSDKEYTPENEMVHGLKELFIRVDNSENKLPSPQYATRYEIDPSLEGVLEYNNLSKFNSIYMHVYGRDAGNNYSPENITNIDIEAPPKVTSGFRLNDETIFSGHTISSLNSNTIVNFNTVQTSRGLDVLYDVELIARHTDTKEEEIVGSPHYGIRDVYNLDMNFTPRDIDNDK